MEAEEAMGERAEVVGRIGAADIELLLLLLLRVAAAVGVVFILEVDGMATKSKQL